MIVKLKLLIKDFLFSYIIIPLSYKSTSKFNILNSIESIHYIIRNRLSVSRFGDGELDMIWGKGNGFQIYNEQLSKRLYEVITSNIQKHIIGLPYNIKSTKHLNNPNVFWGKYTAHNLFRLKKIVSREKLYIDTQISRFYFEKKDKSRCQEQLDLLKKIWEGQNIILVEGKQTRSGIGNDLYDNVKSIRRILGPSENAFEMYDEMFITIKKHAHKNDLILLCYGMTATVLAYDLAKEGYWAIDLGHVDLEYEWFKLGVKERVVIPGKYTNEVRGGNIVDEIKSDKYYKQIIVDITKYGK
ncbi:GT-D fold domain-containing glycosyltransferase [Bacteroides caecigallinarum]|nr:GT-D fold domain-containing glycosyltransferase [Bacteroides caecigallinarum]